VGCCCKRRRNDTYGFGNFKSQGYRLAYPIQLSQYSSTMTRLLLIKRGLNSELVTVLLVYDML